MPDDKMSGNETPKEIENFPEKIAGEGWSYARVRDVFLVLAISAPAAAIALGSASGVPLERMGGVIVAGWAFLLMSLPGAYAMRHVHKVRFVLIVVLPALLLATKPIFSYVGKSTIVEPNEEIETHAGAGQQTATGKGCQPELITQEPLTVMGSGKGTSGRYAWIFWIGNYYDWDFKLNITRDGSGATGTARADMETSPWYSLRRYKRTVVATARGNIRCTSSGDKGNKCDCFADSAADRKTVEDFVLSADVTGTALTTGANLKVTTAADLSGSSGLSEMSVGKEPVSVKLQSPNTAHAGVSKIQSYSYRCVAVR
ncbi:MAG TPA: hypothetical protein VE077_10410 [Candidatus Methylomirabilis sp.]|nr:hypothetical protein [Candidatus Methylomirabilis sp.]